MHSGIMVIGGCIERFDMRGPPWDTLPGYVGVVSGVEVATDSSSAGYSIATVMPNTNAVRNFIRTLRTGHTIASAGRFFRVVDVTTSEANNGMVRVEPVSSAVAAGGIVAFANPLDLHHRTGFIIGRGNADGKIIAAPVNGGPIAQFDIPGNNNQPIRSMNIPIAFKTLFRGVNASSIVQANQPANVELVTLVQEGEIEGIPREWHT